MTKSMDKKSDRGAGADRKKQRKEQGRRAAQKRWEKAKADFLSRIAGSTT
jgi:hypothetical protein